MTYCSFQQLVDQFGELEILQLTDRPDAQTGVVANAVDFAVVDAAIKKAANRIEGYIAPRYALPLSQAMIEQSSLAEIAGYIVRKILYKDAPTEPVTADYKEALSWLHDVQSGLVSLGQQDSQTQNTGHIVKRSGVSKHDWDAF